MIAVRILLIPLAVSLLAVGPAPARVGEEHAPAAPPPAVAARHTLSAVSDEFELVSKNDPLEPGKPGRIDLYLSDFETNAPVSGATVTLQLRSQATGELAWSGTAERDASGGLYHAALPAIPAGLYNLLASINAEGGEDQLVLSGLEVGSSRASAGQAGASPKTAAPGPRRWLLPIAAPVLIFIIMAMLLRRARRARIATLGLAFAVGGAALVAGVPAAHAHEGHDEGPAGSTGMPLVPGAAVFMPKESQFLLGLRTVRATEETVQERTTVLGRVAPRPGGELDIVAPQSGRVLFPGGRVPVLGEHVAAGARVATLVIVDSLAIRAPIGGVVTGVYATQRQLVESGQRIMSVIDPSVVWVHADVYERDLERIEGAKRALVTSQAYPDLVLEGRGVTIGAMLGEVPGTVEAWFEVPNPAGRLRVGMLVDVAIETGGARPELVIPKSALVEKDGRKLVFIHVAPERFAAREVAPGVNLGDRTSIEGDLKPGERVVVSGSYQLLSSPVLSLGH